MNPLPPDVDIISGGSLVEVADFTDNVDGETQTGF